MGVLYLEGNGDYLKNMLTVQLAGRVLEGGHHAESWWYYLIAIPVVWLPWTLLILFVNWLAALRNAGKAWKTRKSDGGSSWLWIWFISGTAILSAVQAKMAIYALPLLAPLAVLTARSLLRLNPARSRCFFGLTAAFLAVVGLGLVLLDVFPFMQAHLPSSWLPALPKPVQMGIQSLNGTMYIGGILILLAVVLLFFTRLALPGGSLLVMAFGMMLALQPYEYQVAPELSSLLSPRAQAAILAEKMQQGYDPAAFHVYPGAYAWHLNLLSPSSEKRLTVPDLNTEADRDAWLTLHPRTVLVMPTADWEQWSSKPEQAELVKTLWMVHQPYSIITITPSAAPTEQDSESSAEIPSAAEAPASDPIKSESSEDTTQSQL
jgi:hypothetical protein